jgi:hypothetical protein
MKNSTGEKSYRIIFPIWEKISHKHIRFGNVSFNWSIWEKFSYSLFQMGFLPLACCKWVFFLPYVSYICLLLVLNGMIYLLYNYFIYFIITNFIIEQTSELESMNTLIFSQMNEYRRDKGTVYMYSVYISID